MSSAVAIIERELFRRDWEIVVGDERITGLRVGFTIDKTLAKEPNTAEIAIYNLAPGTRERLHAAEGVNVLVKAGYKGTALTTLFLGEMREAFSRPEESGEWITVLRAGDGDQTLKRTRGATSWRPGASVERVMAEALKRMGIGLGNGANELLKAVKDGSISPEGLGAAFAHGLNGSGALSQQLDKLIEAHGHQWSVQDGELQTLAMGGTLKGMDAVVLSRTTGLEGSPSVTAKGVMVCRARLQGGLMPGYPVKVASAVLGGARSPTGASRGVSGLWRIDRVRFVGDTHGHDWNAELECTEVLVP